MQAVLITAYRNLNQLAQLAELLSKEFEVYIHIDKRVSCSDIENSNLKECEHIKIFSLYRVNWGGCNHLKAILYLMNEGLKNKEITYFHIISGEDWPVRNINEIYNFFEGKDNIYFDCHKLHEVQEKIKFQKYYSFMDIFDYKKIPQKIFVKGLVFLQKVLGINRFKHLELELFYGLVWGDYPREAVEYCLEYVYRNPEFMHYLGYGFASEEFFFQSILSNSLYWKQKIENKNFRYMLWKKKNSSYPAILDMEDFSNMIKNEYFFARKVRYPVSKELVDELKKINVG